MKRLCTLLIGLLLGVLLFMMPSCVHDPIYDIDDNMNDTMDIDTTDTDTTMMGDPCDPGKVYFERDILPLLQTNCAFSGCHNEESAQDGVILTTYEQVINSGVVTPFRLDNSDLYEVLTDEDEDDRMPPPPAQRLSVEEIQLVSNWILQGATNDSCDYEIDCNTDNIRFSVEIQTILESGCISCHNASLPSAGIRLDSYDQVVQQVDRGRLLGAIRWEAGYVNMPFGGVQLSDCAIEQMELWIDDGMPNN